MAEQFPERTKQMRELRRRGVGIAVIARTFRLSETRVRNILSRDDHKRRLAKVPRPRSPHEAALYAQLRDAGMLGGLVEEHRFHETRMWRFDFAWPAAKVAVEVEGVLAGKGGRHQRLDGFAKDCVKYNTAALLGWMVLRYTPRMIREGQAVREIDAALRARRKRQ